MTPAPAAAPALVAHVGAPVAPHDLAAAWPVDPPLWVALAAPAIVYLVGLARLWRGEAGRAAVPAWRATCALGAFVVVVALYATPLEPLADTLFGAHMAQHLALTLLAAPLIVLARPVLVTMTALPPAPRRGIRRATPHATWARRPVTAAVAAAAAHALTMWVWHVPALYAAALGNEGLHALEHATMLLGALPLWWIVLDALGRHATAAAVGAVFATVLQSGGLAGLLTFAGRALYDAHGTGPALWGLTPLEDQQLAGGLMWFPGGLAWIAAGSWAFLRWLRADERAADSSPVRV